MCGKLGFDRIRRKDGTSEFEDFLDFLPTKDADNLLAVIHNIEKRGIQTAIKMQWVEKFDDSFFELNSKQDSDIHCAIYFHKTVTII